MASTTGVQGYTVNLGEVAITKTLQATGTIISPNFQQPDQSTGTLLASNTTVTQSYVAGINKYIFYYTGGATGVGLNQGFSITGLPSNFLQTYTATSAVSFALIGATTTISTLPVFTQSLTSLVSTSQAPFITLQVVTSTSPVFSAGTAVWKIVITLNGD